jgi:3-hydroxyisobutyrate dehydrogenase-like beta-hydroxyacid dehydrogenase
MVQEPIGVVGLGLLGSALAERLVGAGFSVVGHDPDAGRWEALKEMGGTVGSSAKDVARACRRIVLSLPTSDVSELVIQEMEEAFLEDAVVIDTTTGDPEAMAALGGRLAERGVGYLDATILGSSVQAREGEALAMVGGERSVFEGCGEVFAALARKAEYVGPAGSGAKMKLVANLVLGLNRAALAEGLALARASGLEAEAALRVLKGGAAYSAIMDTKGEKMVRGDFSTQAKLSQHLKDVHLILTAGERAGVGLPLSEAHRGLLEKAEAAGFGDADNSAVIEVYLTK